MGVHPAFALVTESGEVDNLPPFVRRDRSDDLEDALRSGGFVLVVGESTAGKTRAAFEAMRVCLSDHVFAHDSRVARETTSSIRSGGPEKR